MASENKSAYSVARSASGVSRRIALRALVSCSVLAGSAWGVAYTLNAMHEAALVLSDGNTNLKLAVTDTLLPERIPTAIKSSRFLKEPEAAIRARALTGEAIQIAHQRGVATRLALAEKREKAENAKIMTAFARAEHPIRQDEKTGNTPSLLTALVEDVSARDMQPFDLVLAEPEAGEDLALPSQIPLPEARPLIETVITAKKPAEERSPVRGGPGNKDALAYAKPEPSLFGSLFDRKPGNAAWPGSDTKVAIYDVSNATVYLPDGTRLRAHSGIGSMRDNPRYDHVNMRGPTPSGVYRLSMREKRFYGVEAIRMTSIDGRDPKNRTGLLTHTNLLRGQIGSHGCVAFQDYQPFLRAFKRGQVTMLVVVPQLPSSPAQLAALYRKARA